MANNSHTLPLVVACIPYFRCREHICRAVNSLLAQTYKNLLVVVINDGDPKPPWDRLAQIRDPRLVRFDLRANHGPYFATAVVLNATAAPYFLIQDADDWSDPRRVELLLHKLETERSDFAFSGIARFKVGEARKWAPEWCGNLDLRVDRTFRYRAPHVGLFRSSQLRNIGGYYGGFRISWDKLIINIFLMTGKVSHVSAPLYCRLVRQESLTHSIATGAMSKYHSDVNKVLRGLYDRCYGHYLDYLAGRLSSSGLAVSIRNICGNHITAQGKRELLAETKRLRQVLASRKSDSTRQFGHGKSGGVKYGI
jgi:glycosyltransferase involved in cell wall biosynthesis